MMPGMVWRFGLETVAPRLEVLQFSRTLAWDFAYLA